MNATDSMAKFSCNLAVFSIDAPRLSSPPISLAFLTRCY